MLLLLSIIFSQQLAQRFFVLHLQEVLQTLYGGDGSDADVYVIANGSGVDTIIDADDKSTNDTIRFSGVKSTATKFTRSGNDLLITGYGASTDKVVVKQYFDSSAFAMNKRFSFSDKTLTLADMQSLI